MSAPTQVRRPWRATVRTIFQGILAGCILIPVLVHEIGLDPKVYPWLGGILAIAAAITRIMALPQVEAFLRRFLPWLSADPSANTLSLAFGKNPPKNAPAALFAPLHAAGVLPPHPPAHDTISGWGGWQMLGNDAEGDCVAVSWATARRIASRVWGTETYPDYAQVLEVYRTQNPGFDPNGSSTTNGPGSSHDNGMDIQTLLEYLVSHGGPDGVKALAFAKVDHTNLDELRAALYCFGFLWLGVQVTSQNEQEFAAGKPWDYHAGDRRIGGHSIIGAGYDPTTLKFETWAAETAMTEAFERNLLDEAWVVIWPETAERLDQAARDALDAQYAEVTGGKHIAWPAPTPVPTPTPSPVTDGDLVVALQRMLASKHCPHWFRVIVEPWLQSHQSATP